MQMKNQLLAFALYSSVLPLSSYSAADLPGILQVFWKKFGIGSGAGRGVYQLILLDESKHG